MLNKDYYDNPMANQVIRIGVRKQKSKEVSFDDFKLPSIIDQSQNASQSNHDGTCLDNSTLSRGDDLTSDSLSCDRNSGEKESPDAQAPNAQQSAAAMPTLKLPPINDGGRRKSRDVILEKKMLQRTANEYFQQVSESEIDGIDESMNDRE